MPYAWPADTDFALSVTGIAGPGGGTAEKPVGTVFIGLAERGKDVEVRQCYYPLDRETFKYVVSQVALDMLRLRLLRQTPSPDKQRPLLK